MCEDREGTGGVEADAPNGMDIDVVLSHGFFDAVTDAAPDICGGLFLFGCQNLSWNVFVCQLDLHSSRSVVARDRCSQMPARRYRQLH